MSRYYHICNKNIGRAVKIRTLDGRIHKGMISKVSPHKVYLRPFPPRRYGGLAFGWYGYRYPFGFGRGFVFGLAFGAIASLAFIPF